ncbi:MULTISPECIES: hypothetical protein [Tsukamurella]|uniref:Uncharacterized protein n=2 Tax=Tsukamurella TaxID=2060 RepID=A0A5C5S3H7_9ACTN|nr:MULTISPECIES: hypothetical protein [Tsukamurella]NMD56917.1 hypothetical protein [Tsukamurella columbiensis]TWS29819.1 hypothetical protein FK530_04595 [Tsukamurella conjunctivitidis]
MSPATKIRAGAAMILGAVVVPILLVLTFTLPQFRLDAHSIPLDGAPHAVELPAGAEYAVLAATRTKEGAPSCALTGPDGAPIALREVSGGVTVENRMVLRVFDTGTGGVTATCPPTPGYSEVVLGKRPDMARLLGGIFGAFGFALLVGGAGLVLLIGGLRGRARDAESWL